MFNGWLIKKFRYLFVLIGVSLVIRWVLNEYFGNSGLFCVLVMIFLFFDV